MSDSVDDILKKIKGHIKEQIKEQSLNQNNDLEQTAFFGSHNPPLYYCCGKEKVLLDLYNKLYNCCKLKNEKVSLPVFLYDSLSEIDSFSSQRDLNLFLEKKYKKMGYKEYIVLTPIYGISFKSEVYKEFGNIYLIPKGKVDDFISQYKNRGFHLVDLIADEESVSLIDEENIFFFAKKYNCHDDGFAQMEFRDDLNDCVNVFRYLIHNKDSSPISTRYIDFIKNSQKGITFITIAKMGGISSFSGLLNQNKEPYYINDSYLEGKKVKRIMEILGKDNRSDLEKRLIDSLVLCGKSIDEYYLDISFIELATSFEILFKKDDRLVTQSIASSIAEAAAMILYNDYDNTIEIIGKVKELYSKRSSVAHYGGKISDETDLSTYNKCLAIFREVINELLTNDCYKDYKKLSDLIEYLDREKYGRGKRE